MPSTTPLSRTASLTSSVMSRTARPPVVRSCRSCWKTFTVRSPSFVDGRGSAGGPYCEGFGARRREEPLGGRRARRQMPLCQPEHQGVQLRPLVGVERHKEVVLETGGKRPELHERALSVRRHADDVAAPVGGIALPFDEASLLELVEQAHQLTAVVPESVGDRSLRLARALVEDGQHGVVVRVQPGFLVRLHRLILGCKAKALEQERGGGDELFGEPCRWGRGRYIRHRHTEYGSAANRCDGVTLRNTTKREDKKW